MPKLPDRVAQKNLTNSKRLEDAFRQRNYITQIARWMNYSNIGDVIAGTRFVTFKVPLQQHFFSDRIDKDYWFTPSMLLESVQEKGLNIGLVIDLTFTNRYYNPQEFTDQGVQYEKIFVPGHVIPSQEILDKFYNAVDTFLETSDKGSMVGVHCTHGVNRTGYVVCRYMVERLKMKATEALSAYSKARGYPVERGNYIHDLKVRAGEASGEYEEPESEKSDKKADEGHRGQHNGHRGQHKGHRGQHEDHRGHHHSHRGHHHGHRGHHQGYQGQHEGHRGHYNGQQYDEGYTNQRNGNFHEGHHQGGHHHQRGQGHSQHQGHSDRYQDYDYNRRGYHDSGYDGYYSNSSAAGWGSSSDSQWRGNQARSYVSNGSEQYDQSGQRWNSRGRGYYGSYRGSYNDRQTKSADSSYSDNRGGWNSRNGDHNKSDKYSYKNRYERQNSDPYSKS